MSEAANLSIITWNQYDYYLEDEGKEPYIEEPSITIDSNEGRPEIIC